MQRKEFIKSILGTSMLITMDGFSTLASAMSHSNQDHHSSSEFASFGAIHLNNTDLNKSTAFWTNIVGMKLRAKSAERAEFGTESKTLVVVHQSASSPFKKGYSGLYHFAIHAPNKEEFARMLYRLIVNNYPFSPVDHTMSKSFYLDDPDGINIEFTLETPERLKRVLTGRGIRMEDADGNIRSASDFLDVNEVLKDLVDKDLTRNLADDSYLGHIHLYANSVQHSNAFYQQLGFLQFNNLPEFAYADLGAGGDFQHRVAMNSWHGMDKPLAPGKNAGMRHFQLVFKTEEKVTQALATLSAYEEEGGGYWFDDPTGNRIFLTNA